MTDRELVYRIVFDVFADGEMADVAYHNALSSYSDSSGINPGHIKRLSYGVIERAITLDAIISRYSNIRINKLDQDVLVLLEMAVYEILYVDSIPGYATVNEIVGLAGTKSGFVNGVLRSILRDVDDGVDLVQGLKPEELYSLPTELYDHLVNAYGAKTTKKIAKAFLERQGETTLHIDTSRISMEEYIRKMNESGIECERGRYFDDALILRGTPEISSLFGYDEGYFYVQDEASMLPVAVSGIRPGDTVVDVCGAPGGKAIHALMQLQGQGSLSVRDVSEAKVARLRENLARYPYKNVSVKIHDGTKSDPEWEGKADVLLLDVPCTGIGIIGRKPDLKYGAMNRAIDITDLQKDIVRESLPMLRPGGTLVYSTCTINPDENDSVADWIQDELELIPESLDKFLPDSLQSRQTANGRLTVLPGIHQMDGFFVSRFINN